MRFHLWSDLHLELADDWRAIVNPMLPVTPLPPDTLLILAGDIGNPFATPYTHFLALIAPLYSHILLITGNHEYYQDHHTPDDVEAQIRTICQPYPHIHFLQKQSWIHQRVRFLGCTLWSRAESALADFMNDYTRIPDFTPADSTWLHLTHTHWLEEQLDHPGDYDHTVVITHHLPSNQLIAPQYLGHPLNSFFATDLDSLVAQATIWVCGHSHTAHQITIGNCRCYLNPRGYSFEDSHYDPHLTITL